MKRKTNKKRALTRSLLLLLDKFNGEVDRLGALHAVAMTEDQYRRRGTAKKVFAQQHTYFHNAFHEGNRFQDAIFKAQRLTRTKTRLAGADAIYATNNNRRFATKYNIRTDFKRKGRAGKHEKQRSKLTGAITRERASRLEGSFGKDKEYYHLKRIRARTKATVVLWIFFGIHTGNALEIGRRMFAIVLEKAA